MKLSEAIRLGAMLKPQGFGTLLTKGRTCALGAAYDAAGILHGDSVNPETSMRIFPLLYRETNCQCPTCCYRPLSDMIAVTIAHLNDTHHWTREQIADWIATLEAQPDPAVPDPIPVEVTV